MHRRSAFITAAVIVLAASASADDRAASVPWQVLATVSVVKQGDRYVPAFPKELAALDKTQVKLRGFMLPLEQGVMQRRFLLSAQPPECAYCMPGSAEQFAEVLTRVPIKYAGEAITVSGTFELVRDESGGLLYRLTEARPVEK